MCHVDRQSIVVLYMSGRSLQPLLLCDSTRAIVGGERHLSTRKKLSLKSSTVPTRSTLTLVRDKGCDSRHNRLPSIGFLSPSGYGDIIIVSTSIRLSLPVGSIMSRSVVGCLWHRRNRKITARNLPLLVLYDAKGSHERATYCRDNL
jgi:hypothetical protein